MTDIQKVESTETVAATTADAAAEPSVNISVENASANADTISATPLAEATAEKDLIIKTEEPSSILAEAVKAKPEDIKSETEIKDIKPVATETEQEDKSNLTEEPAPLPAYEPFKLPEGWVLEDKKLGEFNNLLAEFEVKNKADHAEVQAFGQKIVEKYVDEIKRIQESQEQAINKIKNDWKESFNKDPELGGNRRETTKKILMEAIQGYSGTPEHLEAFGSFVDKTGVGDNPDLVRLIVNQQKAIQNYKTKYESEDSIRILAGTKPEVQTKKAWEKVYGKAS